VNVSGATGNTTITGSNATAVNVTAGAHSITGGSGIDSIVVSGTGTLAETINGGLGADNISFSGSSVSGGVLHVIQVGTTAASAVTDTGVVPGLVSGATISNASGAFNVAALDKVTGFTAGMEIRIGGGAISSFGTAIVRNGGALGAPNATSSNTALIVGNYDAASQQFTVSNAGTSTLFVYDGDGSGGGSAYNGVVLVGVVDGLQNDTMVTTGVLGFVAG
jgi:hypothetical protein